MLMNMIKKHYFLAKNREADDDPHPFPMHPKKIRV